MASRPALANSDTPGGLSDSVPVVEPEIIHWSPPQLIQPMAWSQGLCADFGTGLAYQFVPCCCGTPQAVRKVNRHLAKYGLHPTQDVLCPCCVLCQPDYTNEFGKEDRYQGEVASGSWLCYMLCPPCYIHSNRRMFAEKHFLPGGGIEDLAIGCCCWGHGLRQMEAYAAMDAEMDIEKARIAREAEALAAQGRGHMQGSRGPLAGIANRILRV